MRHYKRVFLIVIDSLGIGAMPDADRYGDQGADTLGHIDGAVESLRLPNLERLGLGNLHPLRHVRAVKHPLARYASLMEASAGKDTMTGHWEMMGLRTTTPFQTFTENGFPAELLEEELFGALIRQMRQEYDYLIIDTPPMGNLIDGAIVGRQCDGAVMVVESGAVSYRLEQRVKNQLEKSGCRILGVVLNKIDPEYNSYGYYTRYGKYGKYSRYEKYAKYDKSEITEG